MKKYNLILISLRILLKGTLCLSFYMAMSVFSLFGCDKQVFDNDTRKTVKKTDCTIVGLIDSDENKVYVSSDFNFHDTIEKNISGIKKTFCSVEEAKVQGYQQFYNKEFDGISIVQGRNLLPIPGFENTDGCGCYYYPVGLNYNLIVFAYEFDGDGVESRMYFTDNTGKETLLNLQEESKNNYLDRRINEKWDHTWISDDVRIHIIVGLKRVQSNMESDTVLFVNGKLLIEKKGEKEIVSVNGYCGC